MTYLIVYALSGALAGFAAGLLGLGGGVILVPILASLFSLQGFHESVVMPLALGTSLAAVAFTSATCATAHHRQRSIEWHAVRRMTPGIMVGTMLAASAAAYMSASVLRLIFAVYVGLIATQLLCNFTPRSRRALPGRAGLTLAGALLGMTSGLAGVGGATASIAFLIWCNVPSRVAIATAAVIALPLAASGTVGYVAHGIGVADLPPYALGYVYVPALAAIVAGVVLAAPLGARCAYRLPVAALKTALATVLYCVLLRSALSWM